MTWQSFQRVGEACWKKISLFIPSVSKHKTWRVRRDLYICYTHQTPPVDVYWDKPFLQCQFYGRESDFLLLIFSLYFCFHHLKIFPLLSTRLLFALFRASAYWCRKSSFSQMYNIGNNANIGLRGFTTWKQKIPVTRCHLQWGLNPGPLIPCLTLSFCANLACATWGMFKLLFMHHLIFGLDTEYYFPVFSLVIID